MQQYACNNIHDMPNPWLQIKSALKEIGCGLIVLLLIKVMLINFWIVV